VRVSLGGSGGQIRISFRGKEGSTRKLPKHEKHLSACFHLDTRFRAALAISAFAGIGVWLVLQLISRESHSKNPTKHTLTIHLKKIEH
jgi:hypothetical protein